MLLGSASHQSSNTVLWHLSSNSPGDVKHHFSVFFLKHILLFMLLYSVGLRSFDWNGFRVLVWLTLFLCTSNPLASPWTHLSVYCIICSKQTIQWWSECKRSVGPHTKVSSVMSGVSFFWCIIYSSKAAGQCPSGVRNHVFIYRT